MRKMSIEELEELPKERLVPIIVDLQTEIEDLKLDSNRLAALEQAGVDNWDGYEDAMENLRGEGS